MDDDTIVGAELRHSPDFSGVRPAHRGDITVSSPRQALQASSSAAFRSTWTAISPDGTFMVTARGNGSGCPHHGHLRLLSCRRWARACRSIPRRSTAWPTTPFLAGDGTVGFNLMSLQSAVSAHSNALGVYKIAEDGTISRRPHHLCQHAGCRPRPPPSFNLGTPGGYVHQHRLFPDPGRLRPVSGNLPDNLSFVIQGTMICGRHRGWRAAGAAERHARPARQRHPPLPLDRRAQSRPGHQGLSGVCRRAVSSSRSASRTCRGQPATTTSRTW